MIICKHNIILRKKCHILSRTSYVYTYNSFTHTLSLFLSFFQYNLKKHLFRSINTILYSRADLGVRSTHTFYIVVPFLGVYKIVYLCSLCTLIYSLEKTWRTQKCSERIYGCDFPGIPGSSKVT